MKRISYAEPPVLSKQERHDLERRLRSKDLSQPHSMRASIVLMLAAGALPVEIGAALNITAKKVRHWRRIFARERIAGLFGPRRAHPPRKYPPVIQQRILTIAAGPPPQGARRWTALLITKQLTGVDYQYVMKVLRKSNIKFQSSRSVIDQT